MKTQRWKRRFVGLSVSADRTDVELTHTDSKGGLAKMMRDGKYGRHNLRRRRIDVRTERRTDVESG